MSEGQSNLGRIEVSIAAIASIVHEAVTTSYGVVGTAAKNLPTGIVNILSKDSKRGVDVRLDENGQIIIDVYVIVEYGTRIAAVARSVMNVIKYSVERALSIPVAEVNVHIEGLRVSNID